MDLTPHVLAHALGLPPPTDEQAAVIAAPARPALVVAGAGAGKTETMAARVVWLVATGPLTNIALAMRAAPDLVDHIAGASVRWSQRLFRAPGRGTVTAEFRLTDEHVEQVLEQTGSGAKALVWFDTDVVGQDGTVIAKVRKQVYARRKRVDFPLQ